MFKRKSRAKDRQRPRTGKDQGQERNGPPGRAFSRAKARVPQPADRIPKQRRGPQRADYSFREPGSERFFGDFLLRTATNSCPAGGTATAPLRMISSAESFLP